MGIGQRWWFFRERTRRFSISILYLDPFRVCGAGPRPGGCMPVNDCVVVVRSPGGRYTLHS